MYYVTACIKANEPYSFEEALEAIEELIVPTNQEKGCIQFQAYPLDVEKWQIMLWEVWEDEKALHLHHKLPHTVACAEKGYTSVEWILKSEV